jgi:predicted nuclease of predicted toxin-antitoxin system
MKFKVDEDLPIELAHLLNEAGHDAVTVHDEKLGWADDDDIVPVCQREARAFLTFDLGFSDIRSYPPSKYPGLIVFRLKFQDRPHVLKVCERLLEIMKTEEVDHCLWIVEESRVRIRQMESADS